jgi:uncharacterized protein
VKVDSAKPSGPVILSGASGMLGTALRRALNRDKIPTLQLVRREPTSEGQLQWNPSEDRAIESPAAMEGASAAIHLSGASVAGHRWTEAYRSELFTSRVDSTHRLATTLAGLRRPPPSFLVASAIGIYGDRGDELLDETSAPSSGFLADLCRCWEAAAEPAAQVGIRVAHLRFGVVLGRGQGALEQMLPPFRAGFGARLGNGRQWMSWIGLDDAVAAVLFALEQTDLSGPLNVTSPNPVTNADFTHALAKQLERPVFLTIPAFALRMIFGQMADEALLASARVQPEKLLNTGFRFSMPEISTALKRALD